MIHSPFPGMDPYLEAPTIWPDVHTTLMSIVREQLTPLLAPKYLAELETQVVIDRIDDEPQIVLLSGPAMICAWITANRRSRRCRRAMPHGRKRC